MNQLDKKSRLRLQVAFGEALLELHLPRGGTVADLWAAVLDHRELHLQHGPKGYHPVGLDSAEDNLMVSYLLTQPAEAIGRLTAGSRLRVVYCDPELLERRAGLRLGDFQFLRCLGKGVSSEVFLVRHRSSCQLFALKQVKKEYISDFKKLENLMRERKILRELPDNPFTIRLRASFQSAAHLNLLTEFYPGGELFFHMQEHRFGEEESRVIFCQILTCLEFLHRRKILFRDLKPENIVVDFRGHLRIADFGLSKCGFEEAEEADSYCGSPEYMAPEMVGRCPYSYALDFYTLGAILFELVTGLPPHYNSDQEQILTSVLSKDLRIPDHLNPGLRLLLARLLDKDPARRLVSFRQVRDSEWLKKVDWAAIQRRDNRPPFELSLGQTYIHQEFLKVAVRGRSEEARFERLFELFDFSREDLNHLGSRDSVFTNERTINTESNCSKFQSKVFSKSRGTTQETSRPQPPKAAQEGSRPEPLYVIPNHRLERKQPEFKLLERKKSCSKIIPKKNSCMVLGKEQRKTIDLREHSKSSRSKNFESREKSNDGSVSQRNLKVLMQEKENLAALSTRQLPRPEPLRRSKSKEALQSFRKKQSESQGKVSSRQLIKMRQ